MMSRAILDQHPGLRLMGAEMERQCSDALATFEGSAAVAGRIADRIRDAGQVTLYGMGGSHHVNCIAEPLYLQAGIDCRSLTASEALLRPKSDAIGIFTSQSGESGEIVDFLERGRRAYRAAFTLDANSTLARSADDVVLGAGGPEVAFAATRSIILTLTMHAAVLDQLGVKQDDFRSVLMANDASELGSAAEVLSGADTVVFAGRHVMAGVASSAALSLMELARVPTIGFETGQFRHGPFEMLGPAIGVVFLRSAGPGNDLAPVTVRSCEQAGCPTIVLDSSGDSDVGGHRIVLPKLAGLAAAAQMLLTLQTLNIAIALTRIPVEIGTPLRTTKVTR